MSLWRLEWLRLVRTHRIWILLGIFTFFGALGPLTAKYLPEIIDRLGAGAEVAVPPATPELAMAQYSGNVVQIGLLAVVFIAAAALAFDAKPEMSVFLRTRASVDSILRPRYVVNMVAAAGAAFAGSAVAYVGTSLLISAPNPGDTVVASVLLALYLAFAVSTTGLVASLVRGVPATALLSIGVLITIGLAGLVPVVKPWLPSELVGAFDGLIAGTGFIYGRAVATTIVVVVVSAMVSVRLMRRREI